MDGAHDMGGAKGFGPVVEEADEPFFHAEWERRVLAMTLAMGTPGGWNIDMVRFARENWPRDDYLSRSYYQMWLAGLERLALERGLVMHDEMAAGKALHPPKPGAKPLPPDRVAPVIAHGSPTKREAKHPALYAVGDRVRARDMSKPTHTRLPRYVRGQVGVVEFNHGCHVFPDSNSLGQGENPQWLYTVTFNGRELWGEASDPSLKVSVDAWEPYLEPADATGG